MKAAGFIALVAAAALAQARASLQVPLVLEQTIELPGVQGRIDHLGIDLARHQLFVAALGNNTVEVVDLSKGVRARSVAGFHEPQGIAAAPDSGLIGVANGESGDLVLLDAVSGSLKRTIRLSDDADNVRYDASAKRVFVGHGSGAISAIDPAAGTVLGEVRLPAHPESFQLERGSNRIYANVPGADIVAVIDRQAMKVEAKWAVAAKANYPMALDEKGHRLFVGCRRPAKILIYDTTSGRQTGAADTCGDTDDLFFDAARNRVYVSCGEGFLDVFQRQEGDRLERIAHLPTAAGARTSLYVPDTNQLYLAVPHRGTQKAAIRVYDARD